MPDLEERVRRLEDRAELQDLVIRYFLAIDDDDYEGLAAVFASNASFVAGGLTGGSSRDEIVEFIRADRRNAGPTIHTPHYTLLTFHDESAASGITGTHVELSRGGRTLFGAVRYLDDFVRVNTHWLIRRKEMRTVHVGPWEDVGTSLTSDLSCLSAGPGWSRLPPTCTRDENATASATRSGDPPQRPAPATRPNVTARSGSTSRGRELPSMGVAYPYQRSAAHSLLGSGGDRSGVAFGLLFLNDTLV